MTKLTSKQFKIKNLPDLNNLANFIFPFLKPNLFLLLQGDLGVGKTTFTQIIAKKLGSKRKNNFTDFYYLPAI
jgi:tRNA threonylcarbamoyladenosine biosynthesis protein TsaE